MSDILERLNDLKCMTKYERPGTSSLAAEAHAEIARLRDALAAAEKREAVALDKLNTTYSALQLALNSGDAIQAGDTSIYLIPNKGYSVHNPHGHGKGIATFGEAWRSFCANALDGRFAAALPATLPPADSDGAPAPAQPADAPAAETVEAPPMSAVRRWIDRAQGEHSEQLTDTAMAYLIDAVDGLYYHIRDMQKETMK